MPIKNIIALFVIISTYSCIKKVNDDKKNYLTISGKIDNHSQDSLYLFNFYEDKKVTRLSPDGTFSDTMKLSKPGTLIINHATGQYMIYANNGYDISLNWDQENIANSMTIEGEGSEILHFYKDFMYGPKNFELEKFYHLDSVAFKKETDKVYATLIKDMPTTDTAFVKFYKENVDYYVETELHNYKLALLFKEMKGKPSVPFIDYENYDGSTSSLEDFKGSYLFIDVWATWCKPCVKEFPYLKALKKEYAEKNITFLGLSIDNLKSKEKWRKMIKEKELSGPQILSPNTYQTEFTKFYHVESIPHFILLDPNGNVISGYAPLPSQHEDIRELFDTYLK